MEEYEIPTAWQTSVTVPIWKDKGNVTACTSYQLIHLLCHAMKILEHVIDAHLWSIITISPN